MTNEEAIEYAKSKKALLASYIYQDNCAAYGNYAMRHKELEFVNTELPVNFCPVCGCPLTDEAMEMVMERMEALHETAE